MFEDVLILKKGGIHIKKKNRGKFTEYCGGKVTEECIAKGKNSKDPKIRKRATFAANARKWKHENGGIMIPDIIKFFNGGGIPMFQNSGQLGSFYTTDWKRNNSYQTETSQDRGGGISQKDYGEILTDENGVPYRDVRTRRSSVLSENPVDVSFEREYDTNSKMYKKAVKRGWRNPGMFTTNNQAYGYTPEQVDSLTTHFDKLYGTPVVK